MRNTFLILVLAFINAACAKSPQTQPLAPEVYKDVILKGNSWISIEESDGGLKHEDVDLKANLKDQRYSVSTYFYLLEKCTLSFKINTSGTGKLHIQLGEHREDIALKANSQDYFIYDIAMDEVGYQKLKIRAAEGSNAEIASISIGHREGKNCFKTVADDFYWGRRGPSVHLNYKMPAGIEQAEWFYSELTVPENNDVLGSYFMANGFAEGYFGMQVNGPNERRILFSVWSPYKTDNPSEIPEDWRVKLARKGNDVQVKDFGNEGSGGQSFLRYNWEAGKSYAFLLRVRPIAEDQTQYTAWFGAKEDDEFRLIASFVRPKTNTYLKRPHAFLENFYTQMGAVSRMGQYHNQWIADDQGKWQPIQQAQFSADATARKQNRMDFAGGQNAHGFYLKNCGFFSPNTEIGAPLVNHANYEQPLIDFNSLP